MKINQKMKKATNTNVQKTKSKKKKVKSKRSRQLNKEAGTTTNKNRFLNQLIRNNFHITKTCNQTGIPRMTFYQWQKTDKKFAKKMEALRELEIDNFEDAFRDLVEERNPQAVIFGLKTRGRNRGYIEKQEIEHTGGQTIEFNIIQPQKIEHKEIKKIEEKDKER